MNVRRLAPALFVLLTALTASAFARTSFVQDGASMLTPATVAALDSRIGNFNAQTGKEIVVVTVPSVTGGTIADVHTAAQQAFSTQAVNGVLIFVDKGDRKDYIIPDAAGERAGWFSSGTLDSIRTAMESEFRQGNFDAGITAAVSGTLGVYRSHLSSRSGGATNAGASSSSYGNAGGAGGGVHFNMFWLIVLVFVGFMIVRSISRAARGPRYGPGQAGPMSPMGPMGGGYGYGGGGGGFFSGLLGGLGGAWLGNQMFDRDGGGGGAAGGAGGAWGGDASAQSPDAGGWGSDAGQAGLGSGGDFGGGGFGDSGGGDFGGGGGGDSGGGW